MGKSERIFSYQIPSTNPQIENKKIYIPASMASNFNERLANRYVPPIAGNIHIKDTNKPNRKPFTPPSPETTALIPATAKKCNNAVPPKIKGAFIFKDSLFGLFSCFQNFPNINGLCQNAPKAKEKIVITITGSQCIF